MAKMSWYETSDSFWIVDEATGKERCMGDGVDMFTDEDCNPIYVSSDEFYVILDSLMDDPETWEAYFG